MKMWQISLQNTHAYVNTDYKNKSMDDNIWKLLNRELGGAVLSSL